MITAHPLTIGTDQVFRDLSSGHLGLMKEAIDNIVTEGLDPRKFLIPLIRATGMPYFRKASMHLLSLVPEEVLVPALSQATEQSIDPVLTAGALMLLCEIRRSQKRLRSSRINDAITRTSLRLSTIRDIHRKNFELLSSSFVEWATTQSEPSTLPPFPQPPIVTVTSDRPNFEFEIGRAVLREHGTLVVGMSVFSGKFNRELTEAILRWTGSVASHTYLMITDGPGRHNRVALGKNLREAEVECAKQKRQIRGYALDALDDVEHYSILNWNKFYRHPAFVTELRRLTELYHVSEKFRSDCLHPTTRVLTRELQRAPTPEELSTARNFILEELAALVAAPEILNVKKLAYAYYSDFPPLQSLIRGDYDGVLRDNLGFITYRFPG